MVDSGTAAVPVYTAPLWPLGGCLILPSELLCFYLRAIILNEPSGTLTCVSEVFHAPLIFLMQEQIILFDAKPKHHLSKPVTSR